MILLQRKQNTVTREKKETELIARGRHDPCVVPRGMYLFGRSTLNLLCSPLLISKIFPQWFFLFPILSTKSSDDSIFPQWFSQFLMVSQILENCYLVSFEMAVNIV